MVQTNSTGTGTGDPACGDCDDGDPTRRGLDDDGDGVTTCESPPDCDDEDFYASPNRTEAACDGRDNDCDPGTAEGPDADGDGASPCGGDCDDDDPAVGPASDDPCMDCSPWTSTPAPCADGCTPPPEWHPECLSGCPGLPGAVPCALGPDEGGCTIVGCGDYVQADLGWTSYWWDLDCQLVGIREWQDYTAYCGHTQSTLTYGWVPDCPNPTPYVPPPCALGP